MAVNFHSICKITSLLTMIIDNESSVYGAGGLRIFDIFGQLAS
jgi:hypothetical protein